MSKAPNQRAISILKEQSDKNHLYAIINLAAMSEAAHTLTSLAGIKLWMYLAKNQDGYKIEAFSAQGFCEWANVSRSAYNTAFEELREKGYLKLNEGTKTVFTFYERPQETQNILPSNTILPDESNTTLPSNTILPGNTTLPITGNTTLLDESNTILPDKGNTTLPITDKEQIIKTDKEYAPDQALTRLIRSQAPLPEVKEVSLERAKSMWGNTFTVDERGYIVFSADNINVKLNGKFRMRQ